MDLTKLTPAPWMLVARGAGEGTGLYTPAFDIAKGMTWDDAEFAALARNAFDVMMRRGWQVCRQTVTSNPSHKAHGRSVWVVRSEHHGDLIGPIGERLIWANDPFTALVEADKWMRENVENKPA